jgi:hypothetical protein
MSRNLPTDPSSREDGLAVNGVSQLPQVEVDPDLIRHPVREAVGRIVLSPLGAVAGFVVTALQGLIANVYGRSVIDALLAAPCLPGGDCQVDLLSTFFWASLGVMAGLIGLSTQEHRREERRRATLEAIREEELIRQQSVPELLQAPLADDASARIRGRFKQVYAPCLRAYELAVEAKSTPGQALVPRLEELSRTVLKGIAVLVAEAQGGAPLCTVTANVMLMVPTASMSDEIRRLAEASMWFCDNPVPWSSLRGVLALDHQLSCTSTPLADTAAQQLPRMCLPVPEMGWTKGQNGRDVRTYLPGAPEALIEKRLFSLNGSRMGQACRGRKLGASVGTEVGRYFKERRDTIACLVSLPLDFGEAPSALGVLNLHANAPDVLADMEVNNELVVLVDTLRELLAQVVRLRSDALKSQGKPVWGTP